MWQKIASKPEFFAKDFVSEVQGTGDERPIPAASMSGSGVKRKAVVDDHPDQAPQGLHQEMAVITEPSTSVLGCTPFPGNDLIMPVGDVNLVPSGCWFGAGAPGVDDYSSWCGGLDYGLAMDCLDISRIVQWESEPSVAVVFGGALEGMERGPQETTDKLRIALEKIPSEFPPIGLQLSNGFPVGCCLQRPKERLDKLFAAIRSLAGCWPTSRKWNGQGLRVCLLYVQNQSYQLFGHSQKFGMPMPTCPVSSSFCLSTLAKSWASKTLAKVLASQTLGFGSNQAYPREGGSE